MLLKVVVIFVPHWLCRHPLGKGNPYRFLVRVSPTPAPFVKTFQTQLTTLYAKVLLDTFYFSSHTLGFHLCHLFTLFKFLHSSGYPLGFYPQTSKLEPPYASICMSTQYGFLQSLEIKPHQLNVKALVQVKGFWCSQSASGSLEFELRQ